MHILLSKKKEKKSKIKEIGILELGGIYFLTFLLKTNLLSSICLFGFFNFFMTYY